MKVAEIFLSLSGEGSSIGYPAVFVRFAKCNFNPPCSFCDSKYALEEKGTEYTVPSLVDKINEFGCKRVIWTGGEPLLQKDLLELCKILKKQDYLIEVETNGTIEPGNLRSFVDFWHVSLKLSNSSVSEDKRLKSDVIAKINALDLITSIEYKFVIETEADFLEMLLLLEKYQISKKLVCIMPCGTSKETILKLMSQFAPLCIEHGIRLLPREHILIWGNKRGV